MTINYNGISYSGVPETPMQMKLEQFIDIYSVMKQSPDGKMSEDQLRQMLSILTTIPVDVISQMQEVTLIHLIDECRPMLMMNVPDAVWPQTIKKEEAEFLLNDGEVYYFQPNYAFSKLGVIRIWEDFLGDRKLDIVEHLHYIIALCARSKNEVWDRSKENEKARLVLDSLTLEDCYHPLFVFLKTRNELLSQNANLFKQEKKREDNELGKQLMSANANVGGKMMSRWGWYHIMCRLIENGYLAKTVDEMDQMNMIQVFDQLNYLQDVAKVKEMERKRAEQAAKTR